MNSDQCRKLAELYRSYSLLWDPKCPEYSNKKLREEAWENISEEMDMNLEDTKKKMDSLLGSFRREKSRLRRSIATRGTVYKSKWYAYEWFSFLINKPPRGHKLKNKKPGKSSCNDTKSIKSEQSPKKIRKKRKIKTDYVSDPEEEIEIERVEITPNESLSIMNPPVEYPTDPLYTYGQHIANELRKYDQITLSHVKNAINNIIFEADIGKFNQRNPLMETRTLDLKIVPMQQIYNH